MADFAHETVFAHHQTRQLLVYLQEQIALTPDEKGKSLLGMRDDQIVLRLEPPLVQRLPESCTAVLDYMEGLAVTNPVTRLVFLMQAGGAAMGLWRDDNLIAHKVIRKYVKRGNGKAQTTYLKTKGKSRYGSRLRLQNAEALLVETNRKLHAWWAEYGAFDEVYYSSPVRMWPELFAAKPAPPFERVGIKIPLDVRDPKLAELKRVRWSITHGRLHHAHPLEFEL